jgi:protein-S-isoprenylcysteine O-methyltransferase Ste14
MRQGLGSEHPLCDRIQVVMVILFFVSWMLDSLSHFVFGYSTVVFEAVSFPALLIGTILVLCLSLYLTSKAHKAVFDEGLTRARLVDSGVYAVVRHPMYLGTLLFCLSFLFISFSLISVGIWIALFIFYDGMATYEERSLTEIVGEEYVAYQKRVAKWFPARALFSERNKKNLSLIREKQQV